MDRIKQIWIEASRSSSFDSPAMHHNQDHPPRPPPLCTSSTYDDDEVFNKTGLSLLSRYETLGLSAQEVLLATLISPKQRASFLEGLSVRLDQSIVNNNFQLLQALEKTFGKDLQELVVAESKANEGHFYSTNPMAPRHTTASRAAGMATQNDDEDEDAASEAVPQPTPEDQNIPMSNSSMSSGSISDRPHHSSTQAQGTKKKSTPRRFFPDTDMGSFFRSKRRVQNIDWKMAEAVKQVEHLQLDGMTTTSPSAIQGNKNSGGGGSYEPPITE